MLKEAILHMSDSTFAYSIGKYSLILKIRVKKGDMDEVNLYYGDRYEPVKEITMYKKEMDVTYTDDLYDYYEVQITPSFNKIGYYFELISGKEKVIYSQGRFLNNPPKERNQLFMFAYICKADIYKGYNYWKDMIVYEIFVDRFYKDGIDESWYKLPTANDIYGGNLKGILNKLDYLEKLGVNCIYLTPIFSSPSNHKYDTVDYYTIDKSFGDKETLKTLIDECHKKDIKIILDAVFNHTSNQFFAFKDVLEKGSNSKYYNWYLFKDKNNYECFGSSKNMPKFNTACSEAAEYAINVAKYWIKEFHIDGWRLDVANEIDHKFWRRFREEIKSVKPDAFIIGEAWDGAESYLNGDQYDSVMNYPFMYALINYFAKNSFTINEFDAYINNLFARYRKPIRNQMLNLIGSHDTSRFLYEAGENIESLKMAVFFQMTSIGIPMVYYGDELGLTGGNDPDSRRTIDFKNGNKELFNYYKKLISIRKNSAALKYGEFKTIYASDNVYAYKRFTTDENIINIFNNNAAKKSIVLNIAGTKVMDLYNNTNYYLEANKLIINMSPFQKCILKLE
ncbi:glycoside hydrolase family 13 protein [Clostridium guangxiense]|uniref:glycoside hydrolase family 13 protein n=2 Tax=Clostridium TaxID=1485 RepID=UPI001E2A8230|nr:glycoside hydrolase family 13 protein [Clostridium guangxiense]MCD2348499.1 glycoside hydrolase family 13 protein [Clostridium guangxiense]